MPTSPGPLASSITSKSTGSIFCGRHSNRCGSRRPRGERGEKLAGQFLRNQGYKILYRNFRDRTGGEIDIVCREGDTLVFVEVKTRASEEFGRPVEAVDRQKQMRVSKGGLAWLRML